MRARLRPNAARSRRALSGVSEQFLEMASRLEDQVVYRSPKKKGTQPALTVHRQYDPDEAEDPEEGYYFSERAGRDSVAFLLYDSKRDLYGVLEQWHGPLHRFTLGAYTGSLDKDGLTPAQITQEEVVEEAGYDVDFDRIHPLREMAVSGQTNEICHLFLIDVTGMEPQAPQPENIFEASVRRSWLPVSAVLERADWKAIMIVLHANT